MVNYIKLTGICQLHFGACNAYKYFRSHLILAAMKSLIILTVLLLLLGSFNISHGLTRHQRIENRMRMKLGLPLLFRSSKKNDKGKAKGISPASELDASAGPKKTKIMVCQNGLVLNNIRKWRKYCPSGLSYVRM